MKRLISLLILLSVIITAESFKVKHRAGHPEQFKNDGILQAVIDGKIFEARGRK